jgi:hypothetical protein
MTHTAETVRALLLELASGDGVAANLRTLGVRASAGRHAGNSGYRRRCRNCPVAVYLQRHGFADVVVNGSEAYGHGGGHGWLVALPHEVMRFIDEADRGAYPDLEFAS